VNSEDDVRSLLSALPSPDMPESVAQKITARLAEQTATQTEPTADVVALTPRHKGRLNVLLVAAAVAAFAMLISVAVRPAPAPVAQPSSPVIKAGAIYEPADFTSELRQRFLTAPAASGPTRTFADSPQGIAQCVEAVSAYGRLLSIDTGSYDDLAAAVIIATYPLDTEYEEIWVVGPDCGTGDPVVLDHMVFDVDDSTATL
jgi:hypothetical protein